MRRPLVSRRVVADKNSSDEKFGLVWGVHMGVLPSTKWCLVAEKLLRLLSEAGFFTRAYADDVIIVIIVDTQMITKDLMRSALSVVENSADKCS